MKHMDFSEIKKKILKSSPIVFVDAGARGDLEGTWKHFPDDTLNVIAFEPDAEAGIDWDGKTAHRTLVRSALWSKETSVDIHIGRIPSTSSVWPPNSTYIQNFASAHCEPRTTVKVVSVAAQTLDSVAGTLGAKPEFLKIDTQGAEFQILEGAQSVLAESVFGAVIETWTVPVHKGQGLTHDVMALMYEHGFGMFRVEVGAAWDRRIVEKHPLSRHRQIVGLDLLFFKEPQRILPQLVQPGYAAKYAIVAELYGHYDLAMEVLERAIEAGAPDSDELKQLQAEIIKSYNALYLAPDTAIRPSLWRRVLSRLSRQRQTATISEQKLHY